MLGIMRMKRVSHSDLPTFTGNDTIYSFAEGNKLLCACIQRVGDLLSNEGAKNVSGFRDAECLNLDEYERRISHGTMGMTVDMVLGCKDNILLMVEAKLRVTTIENLAGQVLNKKTRYSRSILIRKEGYRIFRKTIVLLNSNNFERNKRKLLNLLSNSMQSVHLMKVEDFANEVF